MNSSTSAAMPSVTNPVVNISRSLGMKVLSAFLGVFIAIPSSPVVLAAFRHEATLAARVTFLLIALAGPLFVYKITNFNLSWARRRKNPAAAYNLTPLSARIFVISYFIPIILAFIAVLSTAN